MLILSCELYRRKKFNPKEYNLLSETLKYLTQSFKELIWQIKILLKNE
jgi:hypothetical protein